MSNRAVRKLQRQEEERRALESPPSTDGETASEIEEQTASKVKTLPLNTFDMLGIEDDSAINEDDIEDRSGQEDAEAKRSTARSRTGRRKKPKKKKIVQSKESKAELQDVEGANAEKTEDTGPDEIDLALQSLALKGDGQAPITAGSVNVLNSQLFRLLAVESKHLNALNEMKRLFGNVVADAEEEDAAAATPARRRGRGLVQLDLGGALGARYSPVSRGQGLKGAALKRNPFIHGKEEWPMATSGGLGMELVERMDDGTVEYRFVHGPQYQRTQAEFMTCVESMDPQRMISMLQFNPYHVSTLLQVSEIAKQQGDHSVSCDLLERALFTFGRSVHSSFTKTLSEGKARFDFRRPENREFWLAAWQYTSNLNQRGTRRTAYEWAKLIFSLDPEGDPYCVSLNLDQLALRCGQSDHYLALSKHPFLQDDWWHGRPNVQIARSLAQLRLKQSQECRATLTEAVIRYPWIFTRLLQELDISHIPKSVWGKSPRTDREKFDAELYIHNAKDLWSPPEAISLLVEVIETVPSNNDLPPPDKTEISLSEARHVFLSGVPTLLNLVPRRYMSMGTSSSDPLQPLDNCPSYDPFASAGHQQTTDRELDAEYADIPSGDGQPRTSASAPASSIGNIRSLTEFLGRFIPQWTSRNPEAGAAVEAALDAAIAETEDEGDDIDTGSLRRQIDQIQEIFDSAPGLMPEHPASSAAIDNSTSNGQGPTTLEPDPSSSIVPGNSNNVNEALTTPDPTALRSFSVGLETVNDDDGAEDLDDDILLGSSLRDSHNDTNPIMSADDSLRRYLAGSGLMALKTFCEAHGTDSAAWPVGSVRDDGMALISEYRIKLAELQNPSTRDFILRFALPQGAGRAVANLVQDLK